LVRGKLLKEGTEKNYRGHVVKDQAKKRPHAKKNQYRRCGNSVPRLRGVRAEGRDTLRGRNSIKKFLLPPLRSQGALNQKSHGEQIAREGSYAFGNEKKEGLKRTEMKENDAFPSNVQNHMKDRAIKKKKKTCRTQRV